MPPSTEWKEFFDGFAPRYMDEIFTRNTMAEVDFFLDLLSIPPGGRVLDIGCGTGRHSVELARRGFRVTGVDLSEGMLTEARKAAEAVGVSVEWIQSDAAQFRTDETYDAAICLCEGAFGLLGVDDDPIERDQRILRGVHDALKPGAPFLLTVLNGYRLARMYQRKDVAAGIFDPLALAEIQEMEWDSPEGKRRFRGRQRGYMPTELTLMLRVAGFEVRNLWGGTAGNWGRRLPDLDEIEIMAVARRAK